MPLYIADESFTASTPQPVEIKHDYLIFYSSIVDGQLWCPDCRVVDGLIKDTFGSDKSPSALIVYVGDRPRWKTPTNGFRGDPWKIESIPTVVKLKDGIEAARLVDSEISAGLQEFIHST
ncbi:uncharacterized protein BT62DRAFT_1071407 [Guyanagaster necrorhizus]|uniref:Thioredoxin domain-containing protein n=1 Tax=Guyanagaster necrorhizus TaxID=856835 RepID=A0A9P7W501_9AGAR|nr:uncharacterized protein BT62DRAFT_1071407 [Guyanagaster necrorhizus MCA 3950]KAG7452243.1 hypothetical protein BT62DRAFT_1071407 [Guyanagaster necrorhizus MCA 3950]